MTATMTRGPLPARVYWTRRVLLLAVVTSVVVGMVQLVALVVGAGSPSDPDRAAPAAAEVSASPTAGPLVDDIDEPERRDRDRDRKQKPDRGPVLAEPEGECADRDIAVTPTARKTVGGSPVTFVLELRTILTPACTWEVSPQTLTVKITSGDDDIWFSTQCPRAIPREHVVIRNNVSTEVEVTWSAKRVDEDCRLTDWALPGWYFIEAAALAGEPSDLQFELTAPRPEVVTETVDPEPTRGDGTRNGDRDPGQPEDDASRDGGRRSG